MKKIMLILVLMMAAAICVQGNNYYYNKPAAISFQTFYDELLPYGEWINTPEYGYVWHPYLDNPEDFRPYSSAGNWVYTDLGWIWVSDYSWGWATFHYGRWYFDDSLGWMWIPGYEWAPAWVTWGTFNNYWAWAPMGPNIQVNVNLNWYPPCFWWTFVPFGHFCSYNWHSYIYNQPVQITNITFIKNIYYNGNFRHNSGNWFYGPRVGDVERHLNARVRKMQVVDAVRPYNLIASNNRVNVYRPNVINGRENYQPRKYRNVGNFRTVSTTDPRNQRITVFNTKRTGENGAETRTSNQTVRRTDDFRFNIQPVKGSAANERILKNKNEPVSGSVKIYRSGPAMEPVSRTVPRYSNVNQRSDVYRQQPVQSNRVFYQRSSPSTGFVRNAGISSRGSNLGRSNTSSRPAMRSSSVRSSSSSRMRHN
jgi:hypothetical protein